jgi:hypothetical protein
MYVQCAPMVPSRRDLKTRSLIGRFVPPIYMPMTKQRRTTVQQVSETTTTPSGALTTTNKRHNRYRCDRSRQQLHRLLNILNHW